MQRAGAHSYNPVCTGQDAGSIRQKSPTCVGLFGFFAERKLNSPSPVQHPRKGALSAGTVGLPAGLAQARDVATHGGFAQLVAAEAELAVHATRTTDSSQRLR